MSNVISNSISLVKKWWLFTLTGGLMIMASIWVMYTPIESYITLAWLFSLLILANGISDIFFSISNNKELEGWGWYLAGGILEVVIGLILLYYPGISMALLPLFLGFWFLFRGGQIIGVSLELKNYGILDWGWIMLFGIALTIMALFMIFNPIFGFINVIYLTSLALLIFGISNIWISFKLKKIKSKTIDKVEEFKKTFKKNLKDMKAEVSEKMKEATKEQKSNILAILDDLESRMDRGINN